MSIDRSLVPKDKLKRHRNVLTRAERVEQLEEEGRWDDGASVFGLAKVRSIIAARKKTKAEPTAEEAAAAAAAEQAEGAEGAEGADGAGDAK